MRIDVKRMFRGGSIRSAGGTNPSPIPISADYPERAVLERGRSARGGELQGWTKGKEGQIGLWVSVVAQNAVA